MVESFDTICFVWMTMAAGTFILLQFVTAPYGRHNISGWGAEISNRLGWFLMESPSFTIILYFFLSFEQSSYASILSLLWLGHYMNRTFIFPLRLRTKGKKIPLVIVLSAIGFNFVNAGLNGYYLGNLASYTAASFSTWNFKAGLFIFIVSFISNQISDNILINLRKPNQTDYKIPKGFLFEYISCPNHLTEFTQWCGFTLMAWNLPALTFLVWTGANLFPRALRHHQWYHKHFDNYPNARKAIIPYVI